jgi:hypothetical protein
MTRLFLQRIGIEFFDPIFDRNEGAPKEPDVTMTLRKISDDLHYVSATAAQWRGGETWSQFGPLSSSQFAQELAAQATCLGFLQCHLRTGSPVG